MLFVFYTSISAQSHFTNKTKEKNECINFVQIEGSTNINNFAFHQQFDGFSKSPIVNDGKNNLISIDIPARNFEASNPMMYDDFLKLIKADTYPIISILIHYFPNELSNPDNQQITSNILVTLAGMQKSYIIPGVLQNCHNHQIRIQGTVKLNLNDFNLEPPTKFLGMVRVNKEVFVNFGLTMQNNFLTKN